MTPLSIRAAVAAAALVAAGHAAAQITFYEHEGFRGRSVTIDDRLWNFNRIDFNDRAASVVIDHGRWEVCEDVRFQGRCVVLLRGNYPSLREIGLNHRISSARPLEPGRRYGDEGGPPPTVAVVPQPVAPVLPPQQPWQRRSGETVYQAPVTSVRAVVGPPTQRCWVERQQVAPQQAQPNVPGAIIGGIVGGILGHQVGGGAGRDVATGVGVVAGAAVGSNVANGAAPPAGSRDVQRCENVSNAAPDYWDVTYNWRGVEHRVQMTSAPGPTLAVNAEGEPRN
ncbi:MULTISPECIES: beta/gamma crystallin family protein [Ramlibacter]|uniref:Beta/gamma crystallin family protein n=1 Tax=Ramlibacter aquaticus TaxID=2780094 RepID=A0ABR9SCH5_9BURK|nr:MULTISPECIES: beta/gamma crystallin family protein [Ramlibacter]MBE7940038.1 beta/gamma crystallin family protein [Ramlibacter aquaticus]